MKLLAVYNTCGISGRDANPHLVDYYTYALMSVKEQIGVDVELVVSSCLNRNETIDAIKRYHPEVKINRVQHTVPVNVSFNHTVDTFLRDDHDGVFYLDSGVCFTAKDQLAGMVKKCTDTTGILSSNVDTDAGIAVQDDFCRVYGLNQGRKLVMDHATGLRNIVSVGCSLNLHCQIWTRKFLDFYKRPVPDIFKGYCTESVFSMQCAAIRTHWHFVKDVTVHHEANMDGQSSLDHPSRHISRTGRPSWDHPFVIESYMDRFTNDYARNLGVCFEQCQNIANPDMTCYDENEFARFDDLKDYLNDNLYLTPSEFDYSTIESEVV